MQGRGGALKKVAAAIAIQDGKVLVARRAPGEKLAGMWEFPGGKVESHESVQQCIVRELAEELGVRASAGEILAETTYTYDGGAIHLIALRPHQFNDGLAPAKAEEKLYPQSGIS